MYNWGTETEMIKLLLDEKTEAQSWEATYPRTHSGEQRSWDHREISRGLVLHFVHSIGASSSAIWHIQSLCPMFFLIL